MSPVLLTKLLNVPVRLSPKVMMSNAMPGERTKPLRSVTSSVPPLVTSSADLSPVVVPIPWFKCSLIDMVIRSCKILV